MVSDIAESPVAQDLEADVLEIVRQVLGLDNVELDDDLFDQGATSLSFVRILARIRSDRGVAVSVADLPDATPRHIAAQLAATLGGIR